MSTSAEQFEPLPVIVVSRNGPGGSLIEVTRCTLSLKHPYIACAADVEEATRARKVLNLDVLDVEGGSFRINVLGLLVITDTFIKKLFGASVFSLGKKVFFNHYVFETDVSSVKSMIEFTIQFASDYKEKVTAEISGTDRSRVLAPSPQPNRSILCQSISPSRAGGLNRSP